MLIRNSLTFIFTLFAAQASSATCFAVFQPQSNRITVVEQLFTSLELNSADQMATRKYSVFDILRIRRDIASHLFIKTELTLPQAFIVPEAQKTSLLKVDFKIPADAQPLKQNINKPEVKSKFDLALNLMIKQIQELGYPWTLRLGRNYLSSRNIPKVQIVSRSEAKKEILYNNNIILLVSNAETKINHEIHLTLDSFLYSPSTGQLVFSILY